MKPLLTHRLGLLALTVTLLTGTLSACVPLVMGGAVVTGMAMVDRRSSGAQLDDEAIELRTSNRMLQAFGERVHINATSYNRQVLLTGEVGSSSDKQQAEQIVSRLDNVRGVVNELAVMGSSSLSTRSADSVTTGRVKAALLDAPDLSGTAFKVVTERGTVYLMGRVTQREAERSTEVVRSVGGVQRVVRVFEYISEADLQRLYSDQNVRSTRSNPNN